MFQISHEIPEMFQLFLKYFLKCFSFFSYLCYLKNVNSLKWRHSTVMKSSIKALFARYVLLNILSMVGVSCYVLADTFFISRSAGADGITVLNMSLPFYNLIYGVGQMIGIGAAIRYSIERDEARRSTYFAEALIFVALFGSIFMLTGGLNPAAAVRLMGGDLAIAQLGAPYFRWMFLFAPAFMANYTVLGFVRNDGDPGICMVATISSSLFNILFDYILVFPLGMGFAGAALATGLSPLVSIAIASRHFFKSDNHIRFTLVPDSTPDRFQQADFETVNSGTNQITQSESAKVAKQSHRTSDNNYIPPKNSGTHSIANTKRAGLPVRNLLLFCRLGLSSFITEMASAVTTTLFNFLILSITGNIGIAAYGVVANFAIVGTALFNGLAQGSQPLISQYYARDEHENLRHVWRLGITTAVMIAVLLNILVFSFTDQFVALFNSENSTALRALAYPGLRIYFLGFLFSGLNIFLASALSAENQAMPSAVISISRGFVAISICAFVLSHLFGMTGVFASYAASEAITLLTALFLLNHHIISAS